MQLHCPHCREQIPADDVMLDRAIARCVRCRTVFSTPADLRLVPRSAASARAPRTLADVQLPPDVTRDPAADALTLRHRWWRRFAIFATAFCVVWDGFLVAWYYLLSQGITFSATGGMGPDAMLAICLSAFPLFHVILGVWLTYYTICLFINRTTITIADGSLRIRHHPLPWPGNARFPAAQIATLFTREYTRARHRRGVYTLEPYYEIVALLRDQRQRVLLRGFTTPEHALFLCTALARELNSAAPAP